MKPFWSEVIREGRWFSRRLANTFAIILASEFISEIGRYDPHFMWGLSGFRISVIKASDKEGGKYSASIDLTNISKRGGTRISLKHL